MGKIQFHENRVLKLTNVLKFKVLTNEEKFDFNMAIEQMQSYIKVKGAIQIGPLIQYTRGFVNENQELDMEIVMMLQCDRFIHNVETPYTMESVIRVSNAMYCRYIGPEEMVRYGVEKINIEAFEKDIKLENCNYMIYVDNKPEEDEIVVDVFIPKAEE